MRLLRLMIFTALLPCTVFARQGAFSFPATVPAGNYSGIAHVRDSVYVVVDDKSATDGFYYFTIRIDSITGDILSARRDSFVSSGRPNRDGEGIAYNPYTDKVFISGETDNEILEYTLDGSLTGRRLNLSDAVRHSNVNYGYEALTFDTANRMYWTVSESTLPIDGEAATSVNGVRNRLRLQAYDEGMHLVSQYAYLMDTPKSSTAASNYAMGVSELCALDDGRLLMLEREFFVPKAKIGAYVRCRVYAVSPSEGLAISPSAPLTDESPYLQKSLMWEWTTRLGLFDRSIANYEGMCLAPKLADGRNVLLLISDSQNQYAGVLKDWFKTIVF